MWGPRARDILTSVCADDLSNEGFRFMTSREITVGDVPCRALRVTYVGELGWELYAPSELGATLWDTLLEAGAPHGIVPAGYRAIDSLRLEKGYRAWGSDVTPDDSPLEAGLAFAVAEGQGLRREGGVRARARRGRAAQARLPASWRTRAPRRWATNRCAPAARSSRA